MKHIKLFEQFKSHQEIDEICTKYKIKNYTINDDGSIDVDGPVSLINKGLDKIPLKFRKVSGAFDVNINNLTDLEGAPIELGGELSCAMNKIKSLEYAPKKVGGGISFAGNSLTSLKGCPSPIRKNFYIAGNDELYSFEYFPDLLTDNFQLPKKLKFIFSHFNDVNLIGLFNDYNIIKDPIETGEKPRLKLSNFNKFLTDNGFAEVYQLSTLNAMYDVK